MDIARHYIKLDGRIYVPGEIIRAAIAPHVRARLLRLGAMECMDEETAYGPENFEEPDEAENEGAAYDADPDEAPAVDAAEGIVQAGTAGKKGARGRKHGA